jgi:hypothetical protein
MARVESAGGIATLHRVDSADPKIVDVSLRLFAKVDVGLLAIDPDPQTFILTLPRGQLLDLEEATLLSLRWSELEAEHRRGYWGGVMQVLRETYEVTTDPETLMSLPFELMPDAELRELLDK